MHDQINWKSFTNNVSRKAIVPIIGNDLSIIRLPKKSLSSFADYNTVLKAGIDEGDHLRINLYKYLSFKLWDIFGSGSIGFQPSINNVIQTLQEGNAISENDISLTVKDEISRLTNDQIVLDHYIKLIRLNGFESFVSVNIDNFLERAFEAESLKINKSFNFSIPFLASDPNEQKDPAIPTIFNLMGSIVGSNFAISDEQCLEYVYMLQNGADTIAKRLFDSLNQKNLLLIGSSFPDWFMRFFIRIISKERFKNSNRTKYVACDSTLSEGELTAFLENNATKVIPIGNESPAETEKSFYKSSIDFINEMAAQCLQGNEKSRNEIRYKETLFISYSWSDKSFAERLRNEFEKNGLNVFFDDDELKTGDRYNVVIKKYLRDCDFFVALISQNAIKDPTRYVYSKEWSNAIFMNDERNYIRPYIIDDTQTVDQRIPDEMRNLNIEKINNVDDLSPVVRKFIKENSLTPISS
jgi:TIR domain/SIR2-like domain